MSRVLALTKAKKMAPAGLRAFAARTPERTGIYSFERKEPAKLLPDQEKKLRANAKAAAFFDAQAPWYRRTATHWVVSAKKEETREARLSRLIRDCEAGERLDQLTPRAKKTKR